VVRPRNWPYQVYMLLLRSLCKFHVLFLPLFFSFRLYSPGLGHTRLYSPGLGHTRLYRPRTWPYQVVQPRTWPYQVVWPRTWPYQVYMLLLRSLCVSHVLFLPLFFSFRLCGPGIGHT
ncbi:Hypothetical predicted protein, partial [Mytilus galloprovincialis]